MPHSNDIQMMINHVNNDHEKYSDLPPQAQAETDTTLPSPSPSSASSSLSYDSLCLLLHHRDPKEMRHLRSLLRQHLTLQERMMEWSKVLLNIAVAVIAVVVGIQTLQSRVSSVQTTVDALTGTVNQVSASVNQVSSNVEKLSSSIKQSQQDVTTLQNNAAGLNRTIIGINGQLYDIQELSTQLTYNVTKLNVSQAVQQVQGLDTRIIILANQSIIWYDALINAQTQLQQQNASTYAQLDQLATTSQQRITTLVSSAQTNLSSVSSTSSQQLTSIVSSAQSNLNSISSTSQQQITSLVASAQTNLSSISSTSQQQITSLVSSVRTNLTSYINIAPTIVTQLLQQQNQSIQQNLSAMAADIRRRARSLAFCNYSALSTGNAGGYAGTVSLCRSACSSPTARVCQSSDILNQVQDAGFKLPAAIGVNINVVRVSSFQWDSEGKKIEIGDCNSWSIADSNYANAINVGLTTPNLVACSGSYAFACCDYV